MRVSHLISSYSMVELVSFSCMHCVLISIAKTLNYSVYATGIPNEWKSLELKSGSRNDKTCVKHSFLTSVLFKTRPIGSSMFASTRIEFARLSICQGLYTLLRNNK